MGGNAYSGVTRRDVAAFAALAVLCAVAWRGMLGHYFWEDDFLCIYLGKNITLGAMFDALPNFRPLDRLSFLLNYRLSGMDPLGYNMVNFGLHLANSFLIYLLGRPLFGSRLAGIAAAAFFATANIHSDAVFWVSARSGLLSVFFLLVSLNLWVLFRRTGRPNPWYYLVLLSLVLAIFSKEEAVVYPLLIVFTDRLLLKDAGKKDGRWGWYMGILALTVAYAAFQAYSQFGQASQSDNIKGGVYAIGGNVLVNLLEIFLYLFTPSFLDINSISPVMRTVVSGVVVAALLAAGYLAAYRRESLWAVLWILTSFLPMSLFRWELAPTVAVTFIRRYFYAPSVAAAFVFGLFIIWLYQALMPRKAALAAVLAVLAAVISWNMFQLGEREMRWRTRKNVVRSELDAVKRLYPSLPSPGTGVYMENFAQSKNFEQSMLRLVYNNESIVLYPDAASLLKDGSLAEKVLLHEKGDAVIAFPSGKAARIRK